MSISQPRATINCDIGEGYYRWSLGPDDELLKLVDYANIACGFHAGDHGTMLRTVRSALKYGVKIGAHPGLDDIKGFGRRRMEVTPEEVYSGALYQLGALKAIVEAEGGKMSHVKVCMSSLALSHILHADAPLSKQLHPSPRSCTSGSGRGVDT